jgi:hypothetical protein
MPVGLGWLLGFRRRRDWTPRAALALEARRGRRAGAGAERGAGAVRCLRLAYTHQSCRGSDPFVLLYSTSMPQLTSASPAFMYLPSMPTGP